MDSVPDILGPALAGFPGWCVYLAVTTFLLHPHVPSRLASSLAGYQRTTENGRPHFKELSLPLSIHPSFPIAHGASPYCYLPTLYSACHSSPWNPASALVIPLKLSFSDDILSGLGTSSSDLHSNHRAFPPSLAVFLGPLAPGPGFPRTSLATLKCVIQV